MKRNYAILLFLFASIGILAQAPKTMSYQAVLRDASNVLLTKQKIGMQISILKETATGEVIYSETHTPTTNENGLVSIEIGAGTVSTGSFSTGAFSAIDWSAGPFFIKTATDPSGGNTYTIIGTSELQSVPFALYAETAENGITATQIETIANNSKNIATNTEAIGLNSSKVGITTEQAGEIKANTAKAYEYLLAQTSDISTSFIPTANTTFPFTDVLSSDTPTESIKQISANPGKYTLAAGGTYKLTADTGVLDGPGYLVWRFYSGNAVIPSSTTASQFGSNYPDFSGNGSVYAMITTTDVEKTVSLNLIESDIPNGTEVIVSGTKASAKLLIERVK